MKFEEEINNFYKANKVSIINTCKNNKSIDFVIYGVYVDVKEKTKTSSRWTNKIPPEDIMILDELSVLRCLDYKNLTINLLRFFVYNSLII